MDTIRGFADRHPFWFVVALAILQPIIAVPFVAASKMLGTEITPLRLIIPTVQSVFLLWLIWALGWWRLSGLVGPVRNTHLLVYPSLILFVPVLLYGTVEISAGWVLFYFLAVLATGVSEEGFARGIALPVLLKFGKWSAVLSAAAIFSAGHLTNAAFEEFTLLQWVDKFGNTFGFAVLYGALFLRTGSLLPLILLHTLLDYIYVTSGTAGPFVVEPLDIRIHLGIAVLNTAVGLYLMTGVTEEDMPRVGRGGAVPA
ncbi:CPBP family intramembrane glutamic endopeptidase [Jannaschia seohaensis]|uniref:CAAX prenyl protease-like protein n=1 Tax=Jannaschia seohaensis TaxID=475081 RepID=A0A2Y9BXP9_9RHOB|nr:CPBP family intramembrane glutamic endopeptidase [Jannaschia seohaensis]PWJ20802.1 CAAX prenyl protease-like protein [Jannaschia seohaensis]SSA41212.1 CAAX protease self-immunity [Jannaschia seohaensis]